MTKKQTATTAATGDTLTATLKPARVDGKPHRAASKKVRKAAKAPRKSKTAPAKAKATPKLSVKKTERDPRLPAIGSTIKRTFKGRDLVVRVIEDGFTFDGQHFSSLSALARSITKYMVSGFVFFGLADRKGAKAAEGK